MRVSVLFGSCAVGHARKGSDVDFLVLTEGGEGERRLSRIIFDWKLHLDTDCGRGGNQARLQIVDFDGKRIEHLFEISSPLVHSAREGIVIYDDGYFRHLLSRPYPKWHWPEISFESVSEFAVRGIPGYSNLSGKTRNATA